MITADHPSAVPAIRRRVLRARLGTATPDELAAAYAEDCAALLSLLAEARAVARRSIRRIRIDERLGIGRKARTT